ncbi:MAG: ROK family protein [Clostridiales bacterium]|nr:ROK family protein [Clostridiales bacterium]
MELSGSKLQTIKHKNAGMVLRLILLGLQNNRSAVSRDLNLTRTTLTNIVSEMIANGIIQEEAEAEGEASAETAGEAAAGTAYGAVAETDAVAAYGAAAETDAVAAYGAAAKTAGEAVAETAAGVAYGTAAETAPGAAHGANGRRGRRSVRLSLSPKAPLICGIALLRQKITVALADMQGSIVSMGERAYAGTPRISEMQAIIAELYRAAAQSAGRKILAVGIASVGPVDIERGLILKPQRFYADDAEFAVRDFVESLTGNRAFLAHDVTAAAVAENLYGNAKHDSSFIYVSIIHGLGVGLFLDSRPFSGVAGQSGELGHISIDYQGELCECGRRGCVEKYIDSGAIRRQIRQYAGVFPGHELIRMEDAGIFDIVRMAGKKDTFALILLENYCTYLSSALSAITLSLGVNKIYISNLPECLDGVFEGILEREINARSYVSNYQRVTVRGSRFGLDAATHGAFAIIMEKLFGGKLHGLLA